MTPEYFQEAVLKHASPSARLVLLAAQKRIDGMDEVDGAPMSLRHLSFPANERLAMHLRDALAAAQYGLNSMAWDGVAEAIVMLCQLHDLLVKAKRLE